MNYYLILLYNVDKMLNYNTDIEMQIASICLHLKCNTLVLFFFWIFFPYHHPIYTRLFKIILLNEQDAQPRTIIALWKANLEEPKIHQSDPSVTIVYNTTSNLLYCVLLLFLSVINSCFDHPSLITITFWYLYLLLILIKCGRHACVKLQGKKK